MSECSKCNKKTGFWRSFYDIFQQERLEDFLREFEGHPEAEALRFRYRAWLFVFVVVPMIVDFASNMALMLGWQVAAEPVGWPAFVSLVAGVFLPNCDSAFVRAVIKRRQAVREERPPQLAESILWFVLPPSQCEGAIGDLNEGFALQCKRKNFRYAQRWYWWHTCRSVSPTVDAGVERLIKWGVFSAIVEWLRRHFF